VLVGERVHDERAGRVRLSLRERAEALVGEGADDVLDDQRLGSVGREPPRHEPLLLLGLT
jgi:hypothetical protein